MSTDTREITGLTIEEVVAAVEKTGNLVAKYWRPKAGGSDRLYANYPNGRKDAGYLEVLANGAIIPHLTGVEGERLEKRLRAAAEAKSPTASPTPPAAETPAPATPAPAGALREAPHGPNRRPGMCAICKADVAAGAGVLDREFDDEDERWIYSVLCADAAACETRRAALFAKIDAEKAARVAAQERAGAAAEVVRLIFAAGECPTGPQRRLEGETLEFSPPLYGRGTWAVIEPEGAPERSIWWVINNGADGDDWRLNNVETGGAGAIGRRVLWTPEVEAAVRDSHAARVALDGMRRR